MDNVDRDFLDLLPRDVAVKILTSLDDPGDLVRASLISRAWHDFVAENCICKQFCLRLFPQLSGIARVVDTSNTTYKSSDIGCSRHVELDQLKKDHRVFATLSRGLTSSEMGECLSDAITASSTDNYPEEGIHNTLEPRDRIGRIASYWSSSGQSNPEVPEKLTYKLTSHLCIITEINIQPFQAFFQVNAPIYSAKGVRFHMGHSIQGDGEDDEVDFLKDHRASHSRSADKHFVWTYTSRIFPMAQENRIQNFKLPEPVLCVGGIVQIELLGRVERQEMDGLFYICMAYTQVVGRSLGPVFSVNPLEPPGTFLLKFNPREDFSTVPNIQKEPYEITTAPEMVQRHIRGWEQILDMLRGTLGVEVYNSEEDEYHDSDEDEDFVA